MFAHYFTGLISVHLVLLFTVHRNSFISRRADVQEDTYVQGNAVITQAALGRLFTSLSYFGATYMVWYYSRYQNGCANPTGKCSRRNSFINSLYNELKRYKRIIRHSRIRAKFVPKRLSVLSYCTLWRLITTYS